MTTSEHQRQRRSPECLVEGKTALSSSKTMRCGHPRVICPFCGALYPLDDLAVDLSEFGPAWSDDDGFREVTGEAYQCPCGAWFIGGMPDVGN